MLRLNRKKTVCALLAWAALAVALPGGMACAGEITVNNLSNDIVWVAVFSPGVQAKDTQCARVVGPFKINDKKTIPFPGNDVYVLVNQGGQLKDFVAPKMKLPYCYEAPFEVWRTENNNIYTLKKKNDQPEPPKNWRSGTRLPEGWDFVQYFQVQTGATLELKP